MALIASALYSAAAYVLFLLTFLYMVAFVGSLPVPQSIVPKSIDSGPEGPVLLAAAVNVLLLALFAVQHSVMARPAYSDGSQPVNPTQASR